MNIVELSLIGQVYSPNRFDLYFIQSSREGGSLNVEYFTFSSSIADNLKEASLVISHAGIT